MKKLLTTTLALLMLVIAVTGCDKRPSASEEPSSIPESSSEEVYSEPESSSEEEFSSSEEESSIPPLVSSTPPPASSSKPVWNGGGTTSSSKPAVVPSVTPTPVPSSSTASVPDTLATTRFKEGGTYRNKSYGHLILTDEIEDETVRLENIVVKGTLTINGGLEVELINCTISNLVLNRNGKDVTIRAEEKTNVNTATVSSNVILEEYSLATGGAGFKKVTTKENPYLYFIDVVLENTKLDNINLGTRTQVTENGTSQITGITNKDNLYVYENTGSGGGGGTSGGSSSSNNLTIRTSGTNISNKTYDNITIDTSLGNGEITLDNVKIRGTLTIKGGGSSSIKLYGATTANSVVINKAGAGTGTTQMPRLYILSDKVVLKSITVNTSAIVESLGNYPAIPTISVVATQTNPIIELKNLKTTNLKLSNNKATTKLMGTTVDNVTTSGSNLQTLDLDASSKVVVAVAASSPTTLTGTGKVNAVTKTNAGLAITVGSSIKTEAGGTVEIGTNIKTVTELVNAVSNATSGSVLHLAAGTYQLPKQLVIHNGITLKGIGTVIIKPASNFVGSSDYDKNLIAITVGNVKLENMTIRDSKNSGIIAFRAGGVILNNISLINNTQAGLQVMNSTVTATNFNTSLNKKYGVNVDNNTNTTITDATKFTLNSGTLSETEQIVSNKGNVTVNATGYVFQTDAAGRTVWSNKIPVVPTATVTLTDPLVNQYKVTTTLNAGTTNLTEKINYKLVLKKGEAPVSAQDIVVKLNGNDSTNTYTTTAKGEIFIGDVTGLDPKATDSAAIEITFPESAAGAYTLTASVVKTNGKAQIGSTVASQSITIAAPAPAPTATVTLPTPTQADPSKLEATTTLTVTTKNVPVAEKVNYKLVLKKGNDLVKAQKIFVKFGEDPAVPYTTDENGTILIGDTDGLPPKATDSAAITITLPAGSYTLTASVVKVNGDKAQIGTADLKTFTVAPAPTATVTLPTPTQADPSKLEATTTLTVTTKNVPEAEKVNYKLVLKKGNDLVKAQKISVKFGEEPADTYTTDTDGAIFIGGTAGLAPKATDSAAITITFPESAAGTYTLTASVVKVSGDKAQIGALVTTPKFTVTAQPPADSGSSTTSNP